MAGKLIMIVDDDKEDIELFSDVLIDLDPEVICIPAVNGMDALRQLYASDLLPDFIFLDLNMPRMDGKGCLAEIKKSMRLQHIPVIIYSTSKLPMDIEETRELGAAYFLTKPTKYTDLRNALGIILFSKSLDDESLSAYLTSF